MSVEMKVIARICTPFPEKFGVPRQSGLVDVPAQVVLESDYANSDALRGIEGFSHLWLIWQFDRAERENWSPTVRPPRLGGNQRMGVFATRSPFRPNPIALSCVKLERVEGTVLHVTGADLVDGTPILDIKPYLPYCDSHPDAVGGWTEGLESAALTVAFSDTLLNKIPQSHREGLLGVLQSDPRPRYQSDPQRVYGLTYGGMNVKFRVDGKTVIVLSVEP